MLQSTMLEDLGFVVIRTGTRKKLEDCIYLVTSNPDFLLVVVFFSYF